MSLSAVFGAGLSGLQAAQAGLRTASQNVSNVNTVGYARVDASFEAVQHGGVAVTGVRRVVDGFLTGASLSAAAGSAGNKTLADMLDRAQSVFGDPNDDTSLFAKLSGAFTRFSELASDPSNAIRKTTAVGSVQTLLSEYRSIGQQLEQLRLESDQRLADSVTQASDLMNRIAALNAQIVQTRATTGDATAVENAQSQLIDQLAEMIDIRVTPRDLGGVDIRTTSGGLLVSDQAASLSHTPIATAYGTSSGVNLVDRNGNATPIDTLINGGSIHALLQARNTELPALADSLATLAASTADALNAAHNNSTSVPARTSLVGRQTGLVSADLLGFTGKTNLAVTDSAGNLVHKIAIDFDARTYSLDGAAAVSWPATETIGQFATLIDGALGASGDMTFTNGVLTVSGNGGNGVFFQDDATTPSSRGGRGFSQFFGLNDIVTRPTPYFFETGLKGTDAHGLTAGGVLSFRVVDASGRSVQTRNVTVTGTTWNDMLTALNASGTGLSPFGSFSLDPNGKMSATITSGYRLEITGDTTQHGALSMSDLFGLSSSAQAGRAVELSVDAAIAADPTKLAIARPDLSLAIGARVLETGDGRGAAALAAAGDLSRSFTASGALTAQTTTLSQFASRLGGEAGRRAEDAEAARDSADAVKTAADARRSSYEGVQLDTEMVRMTQFQQSYAAASRLIQAAKDMYDILLSIK
jgi:flagellar hook-associated protein 1 FlgK